MTSTRVVRSALVALSVAVLATPMFAQGYKLETVALNAALDARKTIGRVDGLARDAAKWGVGTDRWSSLMASGSRLLRLAHRQVTRFERAKISDVARKQIAETKALVQAGLRAIYDARVAVLEANRNWVALRKAASEVRRIDPELSKSILERARWVRAGGRGARPPTSVLSGGRRYFTGRGTGRLTGAELRWLGRRGYVPGGASPPRIGGSGGSRAGGATRGGSSSGPTSRPAPARAPARAVPGR